jgi:hypothetical protein
MIAVRMMQTSADQIINVIAVRNGLMAAARAVLMAWFMSTSAVLRRAPIRVSFGHLDDVFLGAPVMHVLHMTMIEIINMVPVLNGRCGHSLGRGCANLRRLLDWWRALVLPFVELPWCRQLIKRDGLRLCRGPVTLDPHASIPMRN